MLTKWDLATGIVFSSGRNRNLLARINFLSETVREVMIF